MRTLLATLFIFSSLFAFATEVPVDLNFVFNSSGPCHWYLDNPDDPNDPYYKTSGQFHYMNSSRKVNYRINFPRYSPSGCSFPTTLRMDFGDGRGLRNITGLYPGKWISITYPSTGSKRIRVLTSTSTRRVDGSKRIGFNTLNIVPDESISFTSYYNPNIAGWSGESTITKAVIKYNDKSKGLQKPFIIAEAHDGGNDDSNTGPIEYFLTDFGIVRGGRTGWDAYVNSDQPHFLARNYVPQRNGKSFFQRLLDEGYDIVYVDFHIH